ncbi:DNA mismatch repair protein msh6 [Chytridiales sp. JEL 0842]|nr:DNA mismatch repair protein msh6 [Chytridiales sp. JEL 0842]
MLGTGANMNKKTPSTSAKKSTATVQKTITSFFTKGPPKTPTHKAAEPSDDTDLDAALSFNTKVSDTRDATPMSNATPSNGGSGKTQADNSSSSMDVDGEDEMAGSRSAGKKRLNYVISDDEEDVGASGRKKQGKTLKTKKRRTIDSDDDDADGDFKPDEASGDDDVDYVSDAAASEHEVPDSEEEDEVPLKKKTKKPYKAEAAMKTPAKKSLAQFRSPGFSSPASGVPDDDAMSDIKTPVSTKYSSPLTSTSDKKKARAADFKDRNEKRYAWLQDERDAEKRRPTDEGYDPRTLYIPKEAWNHFSPFESQFWQIKSTHWDTVVFFKKGKFYELYEKDADIAHQQFDWKLTDRVNMKMCGVPENSFETWASQFVAKGYKVAKVDQVETAVGKEMREKKHGQGNKKEDKVIRRELTMVLTAGTLVDAQLLTNDMSTYCMSIKEEVVADHQPPSFGICFVDTATAEFHVSFFEDDIERTKFETLLLQLKPKELVLEKGLVSQKTARVLKNSVNNVQYNYLIPDKEYWDSVATMDELRRSYGFDKSDSGEIGWPKVIDELADQPLALSAMGGLLSYLRTLKLDKELVTAGNFHIYDPLRQSGTLVLDGQTLQNLDVFENSSNGDINGTLFKLLNHCITPFGKRMFKSWVCHPLKDIEAINDRLDAVDDMYTLSGLQDILGSCLTSMPDLERVISRIHAGTCRVKDFIIALAAFDKLFTTIEDLQSFADNVKSKRLRALLEKGFPGELKDQLTFFKNAFDHRDAMESGVIVAHTGYDEVFDEANDNFVKVEEEFEEYRKEQMSVLNTRNITYKDMGKDLYLMEVPAKVKVPNSWKLMSKTQSVQRYYTNVIESLLKKFLQVRELREEALKNVRARMFEKFDEHYQDWLKVIKNIAEIDCYLGLALCRDAIGSPCCRPQFVESDENVFEVEELRHPSVIMAQLGCYVPASSFRLTPFDRIFTRIGANDNILAGQSTFMVELSETSKILREATPRSLVILDELGRGTSTFDGYAIAFAVLHHLLTQTQCLGLFSTHYGMLTREFEDNPLVALNFMNFVSNEDQREVTFLYKLTKGASPKSFGMNVASMAGVPGEIVDKAEEVAAKFEQDLKMTRIREGGSGAIKMSRHADFSYLWQGKSAKSLKGLSPILRSLAPTPE